MDSHTTKPQSAALKPQQQQQQQQQATTIDCLNDDILMRIFDFLHFDDKIRLRRTSTRWKALLDYQIERARALRLGLFQQGGYNITSGLQLECGERAHRPMDHRRRTGTLFGQPLVHLPANLETHCFSLNQYDYLHRSLKYCHKSITMLSLGRLQISYRLLTVLANNLPQLEHLEIVACAAQLDQERRRALKAAALAAAQASATVQSLRYRQARSHLSAQERLANEEDEAFQSERLLLPSLDSFEEFEDKGYHNSMISLYNQHEDEQVNIQQRFARAALVKSCDLVRDSRTRNYWPNLRHLLIKDSSLFNEFSLSLLLAITNRSLVNLHVESNQYLTGEFINYCSSTLKILRVRYCPLIQVKFFDDFMKLRKLLTPEVIPDTLDVPGMVVSGG